MFEKHRLLKERLRAYGTLVVAFSGGVDSTFLLASAYEVLGPRVIAVMCRSPFVPERESREALEFCEIRGIRLVTFTFDPFETETLKDNPPDRCYHCKRAIFSRIMKIATDNGITVVAEGSNVDDLGDYRPGMRAIEELGVKSPLREAGLTKQEIRQLSKNMELPTWDKPSYACLASRLAYGEEITEDKLKRIELAEEILIGLGYKNERVRLHGDLARIEVMPEDIPRLAAEGTREMICERFRALGFLYVTLDLGGYKMGSMNDTLVQ